MSKLFSIPKTPLGYGFKIWIFTLFGPILIWSGIAIISDNSNYQNPLLFNCIMSLIAALISIPILLVFGAFIKYLHSKRLNKYVEKSIITLAYAVGFSITALLPMLYYTEGLFHWVIIMILIGLGAPIYFICGFIAIWVFNIETQDLES